MLIFKELEDAIKTVRGEANRMKNVSAVKYEKAVEKMNALNEILMYIKNGEWATTKKTTERLLYVMKNGAKSAAEYYGTTEDSIAASMSQYSKRIRELIGADTIPLIVGGNVEEGLTQFRCCSGTIALDKLLVQLPITHFPKHFVDDGSIKLSDCGTELQFIGHYLNSTFNRELEKCDPQKLAFLRWLLDKNVVSIYERTAFMKYLVGEISYNDLMTYLAKQDNAVYNVGGLYEQ